MSEVGRWIRGGKIRFVGQSVALAGKHVGNCKYVLLVISWPGVPRGEWRGLDESSPMTSKGQQVGSRL